MMAAHKLEGKQKAMLISSSIRNTGRKKKINICQIEKVNIRRERNFRFEILRGYCPHRRHSVSSLTFVNHRILKNKQTKTSVINVSSNQVCEMMVYELNILFSGKGNIQCSGYSCRIPFQSCFLFSLLHISF